MSTKGQKITVPDVGTKPLARMHLAFGFLVSKEIVVLRWREGETKIRINRLNFHRERFRKLTCGALALRQGKVFVG